MLSGKRPWWEKGSRWVSSRIRNKWEIPERIAGMLFIDHRLQVRHVQYGPHAFLLFTTAECRSCNYYKNITFFKVKKAEVLRLNDILKAINICERSEWIPIMLPFPLLRLRIKSQKKFSFHSDSVTLLTDVVTWSV